MHATTCQEPVSQGLQSGKSRVSLNPNGCNSLTLHGITYPSALRTTYGSVRLHDHATMSQDPSAVLLGAADSPIVAVGTASTTGAHDKAQMQLREGAIDTREATQAVATSMKMDPIQVQPALPLLSASRRDASSLNQHNSHDAAVESGNLAEAAGGLTSYSAPDGPSPANATGEPKDHDTGMSPNYKPQVGLVVASVFQTLN